MKKFVLVMIAAVMALGMSAFTTVESTQDDLWYYGSDDEFHIFTDEPCTEGNGPQCVAFVSQEGVALPIYTEPNFMDKYYKVPTR